MFGKYRIFGMTFDEMLHFEQLLTFRYDLATLNELLWFGSEQEHHWFRKFRVAFLTNQHQTINETNTELS